MSLPADPQGSADEYYEAAIVLIDRGEYNDAIVELRLGIHVHPRVSKLHALLGVAYFDIGNWLMTRSCVNLALKLDDANEIAQTLDKILVACEEEEDYLLEWDEDDDWDDGLEPNSKVPLTPYGPLPGGGAEVDPYKVEVLIP